MRLRVVSKTGRPRSRAGFTFTSVPQVVDVSGLYPVDEKWCRDLGDWPPPQNSDGSREKPTDRAQLILDDTDLFDEDDGGKQLRHGGLHVDKVPDDYEEGSLEKMAEQIADLAAERDEAAKAADQFAADARQARQEVARARSDQQSLASRVAELEAQLAKQSTGAPERLAPKVEATTTPATPPPAPTPAPAPTGKGAKADQK